MIPLFLSDADGTLYFDGKVHDEDMEAIRRWCKAGYAFGLVTGRAADFCGRLAERHGFSCQVLVCDNGARVLKNGVVLSDAFLGASQVKEALRALAPLSDCLLPFVTFTDGYHYFPRRLLGDACWHRLQQEQAHLTYFADVDLEDLLDQVGSVPGISLYVRDEAHIDELLEEVRKRSPLLWHKTSHDYIEASVRDKAEALQVLFDASDYGPVFFVGDGSNDIPVFDLLEDTFVMAGAADLVKAHSCCQVESVAEALERSFEYVQKKEKESRSDGGKPGPGDFEA